MLVTGILFCEEGDLGSKLILKPLVVTVEEEAVCLDKLMSFLFPKQHWSLMVQYAMLAPGRVCFCYFWLAISIGISTTY